MLNSKLAASHPAIVLATRVKSSAVLDKNHRYYHVSVSLDDLTERKLRDLAFQENASESSIVEVPLRGFFDSGRARKLHAILT
jgi:hypothetical protein